jgi:hypothetical protein
VCQNIAEFSDEGVGIDAIIIDFSKAFDLVPHDRLLTKLATSIVDSREVVWERECPVRRTPRFTVGGQLFKEVKVTSGVPRGRVLGPLLFLMYLNDIWKNIDPTIKLFTDDCVTYRKSISKNDIEKLQKDLSTFCGVGGRKWDENKSR